MKNYNPKYNWHQGQLCQENKYRKPAEFEIWTLYDEAIEKHFASVRDTGESIQGTCSQKNVDI